MASSDSVPYRLCFQFLNYLATIEKARNVPVVVTMSGGD